MHRRSLLAAAAAAPLARVVRAAPAVVAPVQAVPAGVVAAGVVMELFTSQGCSDCPPADALLGEMARQPGVVALAWHVDYWDRLGWRDPFSSKLATERERSYASRLGNELFTPALVVNGRTMLVGSDRPAVTAAAAAAAPLPVAVGLSRGPTGATARIGAANEPVSVLFAAWDPTHETKIGAGENDGRRLREYRIVRTAVLLASGDGAGREFALPAFADGQGATVLVQGADLHVLGAAELPPA